MSRSLQAYTVHQPPNAPDSRYEAADRLVFVREGFSWAAAAFGPLWLLVHRMWLVLAAYVIVLALLLGTLALAGIGPQGLSIAASAFNIIFGYEAGALRRWTLERRRWRTLGTVTGRNAMDCERRFLQLWLSEASDAGGGSAQVSRPATPAPPSAPEAAAGSHV